MHHVIFWGMDPADQGATLAVGALLLLLGWLYAGRRR